MKPLPLVFALAAAALTVRRWRGLSRLARVLWLSLVAVLVAYGARLVPLPSATDVEHAVIDVGQALGDWTYPIVGFMAFLETGAFIGLIAPGELAVMLGGVVAGQGVISPVVLITVVWGCALAGDTTSFLLGRRKGRGFLLRHGPRFRITESRLEQVERFLAAHGGKTILIGRFLGLVRALAPFIAGSSNMPFRRFFPYAVIGTGLWGATYVTLGFVFWESFDRLEAFASRGAFALGAVVTLVGGVIAAHHHFRERENRARAKAWIEEQAERPGLRPAARALLAFHRRALRPAWRRVAGPLRFLWGRITPGELGLELTTLLAVALVGAFLFASGALLLDNPAVLGVDGDAHRLGRRLRIVAAVDVASALTWVAAFPVVAALVALSSVYLAATRRVIESLVLPIGLMLTVFAVHFAKDSVARARPAGSFVETQGFSYPSGHAAYSVALVAVAVALVRVGPGWLGRFAVVGIALGVAAAAGLTRIYLRAHFLSDVIGGWGLGAAIFAICGMVALIVAFLRDNGR